MSFRKYKICLDGIPLRPVELAHYNAIFKAHLDSQRDPREDGGKTPPPPDMDDIQKGES